MREEILRDLKELQHFIPHIQQKLPYHSDHRIPGGEYADERPKADEPHKNAGYGEKYFAFFRFLLLILFVSEPKEPP